jgi:hypothetical protein
MKKHKWFLGVTSTLLAAGWMCSSAQAGRLFTGQFGSGNTWNIYEAIETGFQFKDALDFSLTREDPTGGTVVGHLVTLQSLAENNFVQTNAGGNRWIGLTDRVGVAPGATESAFQPDFLTQGWVWVTGEPFTFQNWGAGEPNDAGGEDAVHLGGSNVWNDNKGGWGFDEPVADIDSLDESAGPDFGFVIEWRTNLAAQPVPGVDFPETRPDPKPKPYFTGPLERMPGPNGTDTQFGILEVRDLGGTGSVRNAIANITSGNGTRFEGFAPKIDLNDPESGGNQGSIAQPQIPFVSDTPGVDDDNIQSVIKGTVVVPEGRGGDYTINVRSDDGFAMRFLYQDAQGNLVQQPFQASRGGGSSVDEVGTLAFAAPTGDSNTQGLINLPSGTYDVEFIVYENGGGAFWEVSSASGDYVTTSASARWVYLGSPEVLPAQGPFKQPVRMTEDAYVFNGLFATDVQGTIDEFRNFGNNPTAEGFVDSVILTDSAATYGPGAAEHPDLQRDFPNLGITEPHDFFTTAVTGKFEVLDTDGVPGETLTFGLFADDNAALHIKGQNFTQAGGDPAVTLGTPIGESDTWLIADFRTGNTNALGLITLTEGTYDFEAFQLEDGGGAGLAVWAAAGDYTTAGFNGAAFFPLTTQTLADKSLAANFGLGLVAGPGTGPSESGIAGDFNNDGVVDGADLAAWEAAFGEADGFDGADFLTWQRSFGSGSGGAAAVPEPASLLGGLLGLAAAAMGRGRRRR